MGVRHHDDSGLSLYVGFFDGVNAPTFVDMTEPNGDGWYIADDTAIGNAGLSAGDYAVAVFEGTASGASASDQERGVTPLTFQWDGSAELPQKADNRDGNRTVPADGSGRAKADVERWRGSQPAPLSGTYVQARSENGNALMEAGSDNDTGKTLSDQLDTVQSKTSQIGSGSVSHVSPVDETGKQLRLVRGDDYTTAANQALDWTDDDGNWPDLTGATIRHTVRLSADDSQVYQVTGSVVVATGSNKQVRAEPTNAETSQLTVGTRKQYFDVEAELSAGDRRTLVRGPVEVVRDATQV